MSFDPSAIKLINVIDTCSIWNLISSELLFARSNKAGFHYSCTKYVKYECVDKPRRREKPSDSKLVRRFQQCTKANTIKVCDLTLDDLLDPKILQFQHKLGIGELSSIAFALRINHAFLTDDQKARRLGSGVLGPGNVNTSPFVLGRLVYFGFLGDSDIDVVVAQHSDCDRPLGLYFREAYKIAMQHKLKNANPSGC